MADILLKRDGDIAIIEISNISRKNAWTREMRAKICELLHQVDTDSSAAGAVLVGAGDAFCSGQDFNESSKWTADVPWVEEFESFFRAILQFSKPLVAAVNGDAAGSGFQIALICDRRLGHPGTRMGQTEVRWGMASVTGTWLMRRSVGDMKARELALSGRLMESDELLACGVLNKVVPQDQVLSAALASCRELAKSPHHSFRRTKAYMYESMSAELAEVCRDAARVHGLGFASGESQADNAKFLRAH